MASMSASETSALGRSTARSATGLTVNSGNTSTTAVKRSSAPGSAERPSMRGSVAGRNFSRFTASEYDSRSRSPMTSVWTCEENCCFTTANGALPGRKPLRRAVRASCFRRVSISPATRSAGTATSRRRSRPATVLTETCMLCPASMLIGGGWRMVRKERLELSRVSPLEPKSSAFTSSATFAPGREGGGPCRDRTYDQLIKSQLLYQLS